MARLATWIYGVGRNGRILYVLSVVKLLEFTMILMAAGDKQKGSMEWVLVDLKRKLGLQYEKEFMALKPRKYRFDFAIPEIMLAIEYEGGMGQFTSGKSRHTTKSGYTEDTNKYNLAAVRGWTVLRYTAKNYGNMGVDILAIYQRKYGTMKYTPLGKSKFQKKIDEAIRVAEEKQSSNET